MVPFLEGDRFYLFTDDRDLTMLDARSAGIHTGHVAPPATPGIYKADPMPAGTKSRPRMRRTGS